MHNCFLMRGPLPVPKTVHHRKQFIASSFNFHYLIFFLRSFSSCLRILPRLPVTSTFNSVFPIITHCRRQFLRKMWPNQLALFYLLYVVYSSLPWTYITLLHFSHDRSKWPCPPFFSTTFQNHKRFLQKLIIIFTVTHVKDRKSVFHRKTDFLVKIYRVAQKSLDNTRNKLTPRNFRVTRYITWIMEIRERGP